MGQRQLVIEIGLEVAEPCREVRAGDGVVADVAVGLLQKVADIRADRAPEAAPASWLTPTGPTKLTPVLTSGPSSEELARVWFQQAFS